MTDRTIPIDLPLLPLWFLRLAADAAVQHRFGADPMAFATWYVLMAPTVDWPEEVIAIQRAEQTRKLSLERMVSLLTKVNYSVSEHMGVAYARRVLEGYAVHDWVSSHGTEFAERIEDALRRFEALRGVLSGVDGGPGLSRRLDELATVLTLRPLERQVLSFAIACSVSDEVRTLAEQLARSRKSDASALWSCMFGCSERELSDVLASSSALRTCRILGSRGDAVRLPTVSEFWVRLLLEPRESLLASLAEPMAPRSGAGIPARLANEDMELAARVLSNARGPGVNLLLYGADGLEKRAVLHELVTRAGKQPWRLREFENAWQDMPTVAYVAQRALHARHGDVAVLVIERPSDVLERKPSEFLRKLFGLDVEPGHIAPFDELMLDANPSATLWTGVGASRLPEETMARFVFHAPMQKARREERRAQLELMVSELKLTKKTTEELLRLEDVSAQQLATAVKAASLSGATNRKEREAALVQAVRRSLKALERNTAPKAKECVTEYSLKYLNTAGRFGPQQVLKALARQPRGSLCLYGPPGTGKTQFVEHMAQALGRRLLAKRASDLLSKWVGESEQNIAQMFAEAENEEAILFLDEGDSFLRDRSMAQASWEVTKVNELLQHMERFEGIFVVATNLFRGLDAAALRRFTFKIEFSALSADQRWEMFVNEAGLKGRLGEFSRGVREQWFEDLCFMPQLAAGDFATVKRQCLLLGESLSPEQWVEQLRLECAVKSRPDESGAMRMAG